MITIPTEPIGSIPRPLELIDAVSNSSAEDPALDPVYDAAINNLALPAGQLGTTDDCGFAPFSDDKSTTRDTAFAKIRARVAGIALAAERLAVRAT